MSIPFNDNLKLETFNENPNWHLGLTAPLPEYESQQSRALEELSDTVFHESLKRSEQFIRDLARLVLKVPIRSIATPIILEKNWQERERAKVNAKLAGYSFIHLLFVPAKFIVALAAIASSKFSNEIPKQLIDATEDWSAYLDGRASQLEALKEEGVKKANTSEDLEAYRSKLYKIDPRLCRKPS